MKCFLHNNFTVNFCEIPHESLNLCWCDSFPESTETGALDGPNAVDPSCLDFRFSIFDVALLDLAYPNPISDFDVQATVAALMEARPERQAKMLDTLAQWQAGAGDKRWAASVVKQVLEEFEQAQFLASQEAESQNVLI